MRKPFKEEFDNLLGRELEEAREGDNCFPLSIRVTKKDGEWCIVTRDYRYDRVNVAIENGVITEVFGIG